MITEQVTSVFVRKRKWIIVGAVVFLLVIAALLAAGPTIRVLVRDRSEQMLESHFASTLEFSNFDVTLFPRVHVTITDLVLRHKGRTDIPPLVQIRELSLYANLLGLMGSRPHVSFVQLHGLQIHTPPRVAGGEPLIKKTDQDLAKKYPVLIEEIHADDASIIILRAQTDRPPREFPIHYLELHDVSFDRPSKFHALLTNPVPKGEIDCTGEFGPWLPEEPSQTPTSAKYTFQNADLGTLKGLRGILSSKGQFTGPLDYLSVEGFTDTPDFGLRTTGHPVALHTEFSALVDGTNGNVILKSVTAKFLHTVIVANGEVVDINKETKGRTIQLITTSDNARIEDLLHLVVSSDEPMMTGAATLSTKISIPEGDADLLERLNLNGQFGVGGGKFTNPDVQGKIDKLSRKGQGQPESTDISDVVSALQGRFKVANGVVNFSDLSFAIAGASLKLHGTYNLDTTEMDFHGKLLMQAKLSQTTTGAKSFFLKAIDPFFKGKNGGTELPIKITGTKDHPSFGMDSGGDSNKGAATPPKKTG